MKYLINNKLCTLALLLSGFAYYWLAFETPRTDFNLTIGLFSLLFAGYFVVWQTNRCEDIGFLAWTGIAFRALVLFATPALSDDIYRYLWDGQLSLQGVNPYLFTPTEYLEVQNESSSMQGLYSQLNSPDYYSVYPGFAQWLFALAAALGTTLQTQVILFKSLILLCEIGTIYVLRGLIHHFQLGQKNVLIYALNPLVIMEICGNGHLEGVMIFCSLLAIYWMVKEKWVLSSIPLGLAISVKLIPLLMIPFIVKRAGLARTFFTTVLALLVVGVTFIPFWSPALATHISSSLELYFHRFEFNASVYYLARSIGQWWLDYNPIATLGTAMGGLTFIAIGLLAIMQGDRKWGSLFAGLTLGLATYYLLALVVHPWYITWLVALSALTKFRFGIVWSFAVLLSYATYMTPSYTENVWLISLEYAAVATCLVLEIRSFRAKSAISQGGVLAY